MKHVVGVDCFTDYYPRDIKERNLQALLDASNFDFFELDLLEIDLTELLQGVDYVFHEAAQAGVRASWGADFEIYTKNNVLATQRLLEAAKETKLEKFVYASSSSVYGDAESYPTSEDVTPKPISPYGVTKLAGEHLCKKQPTPQKKRLRACCTGKTLASQSLLSGTLRSMVRNNVRTWLSVSLSGLYFKMNLSPSTKMARISR